MKKVLIILLLIFVPCFVFAKKVDYGTSASIAQNYFINSYKDYKKYLKNENGELLTESEYNITKSEYNITNNNNNNNNNKNNSYLNIGSDFWFKENDDSGKKETRVCNYVLNDSNVSGNGSYTSPWVFEELYKVSLISNNNDYGEINNPEQYVKKGEELNFSYNPKPGYKYRNISCNDNNDDNVKINKVNNTINIKNIYNNINCKVSFELNTFIITFNANGGSIPSGSNWTGSGNSATKAVIYNDEYAELPVPTRDKYRFDGWYTSLDNTGVKITSKSILNIANNHTLYAKWTKIVFALTVDINGGSCNSCATSGQQNAGTKINLGTPSRENYTFTGWKIISGSGNLDKNTITIGYSNVKVQAQWFKHVVYTFDYKGYVETFKISESGKYKLEVWGAQGGNVTNCGVTVYGGKGGYATGTKTFTAGQTLYIVVGGQGSQSTSNSLSGGGYNGGGNGKGCIAVIKTNNSTMNAFNTSAGGGGATHIATTDRGFYLIILAIRMKY